MKTIDLQGMTNMEIVRGSTDEWYWSTDYIHGDLYEAEELFRMGHPGRSINYTSSTIQTEQFVNKVAEYMVEDKTVQEIFDAKLYRNLSVL